MTPLKRAQLGVFIKAQQRDIFPEETDLAVVSATNPGKPIINDDSQCSLPATVIDVRESAMAQHDGRNEVRDALAKAASEERTPPSSPPAPATDGPIQFAANAAAAQAEEQGKK